MVSAGLSKKALVVGGDVLSKILDWTDRSTSSSSVTEPALWCSSESTRAGSKGSSWARCGGGGKHLWLPGSGSRTSRTPTGW